MLAIKPQNSSGFLVMTWGPGCMSCIIMAPIISAMTTFGGNTQRQHRNERGLRAGVVGGLRACHAFDGALAEARRVLGKPLLDRIGGE